MDGRRRRALVIGVRHFTVPCDEGGEPQLSAWDELPYAVDLTERLAGVLQDLGFEVTRPTDPTELTAGAIGTAVSAHIQAGREDDLCLVHVLSHGHATGLGRHVEVVGSDAQSHHSTDLNDWVRRVESHPEDHRRTLFTLDVCGSGEALKSAVHVDADVDTRRALVASASSGAGDAYDGQFTRALITTLEALRDKTLDLASTVDFLPWALLETEVLRHFDGLTGVGATQRPQFSQLRATAIPPFLPRPADTVPSELEVAHRHAPVGAADLIDGLDVGHFRSRAAGWHDPTSGGVGLFQGRTAELSLLSTWLDANPGGLRVVTGAPGAGKSAVLGVLACAAHPALRGPTEVLWGHLPHVPARGERVAAVHARDLTVGDVVEAICTQLSLGEGERSTAQLVDRIGESVINGGTRPIVIVDAVDEARDTSALVTELLVPLSRADRDGSLIVSLVAGTRSGSLWPEVDPLLGETTRDETIDLNSVSTELLRADLRAFADRVLARTPAYDRATARPQRIELAETVAAALTTISTRESEWGAFLVAGIYLRHLTQLAAERETVLPPEGVPAVPTTLPAAFELQVGEDVLGRSVLAGLAWAQGRGVPIRIATELVAAATGARLTQDEVAEALDRLRFYLRTDVDRDGTTIYRLFHQGLVEHLRDGLSPREVSESIVDRLRALHLDADGVPRWDTASPYVLRHLLDHAETAQRVDQVLADHEFTARAEPESVLRISPTVLTRDETQLVHAAYGAASAVMRTAEHRTRRAALEVNILRLNGPLGPPWRLALGEFSVAWATGGGLSSRQLDLLMGHAGPVVAVVCTTLPDGTPVAVTTGHDRTVRLWDLRTRTPLGDPLHGHTGWVLAVACTTLPDGTPVAVTTGHDSTVRLWDLESRASLGQPLALPEPSQALSASPEGHVVIAFGWDVLVLEREGY